MKPMHMFSPLRKQPGYPTTSVDLTIADVTYDLMLPAEVSDELLVHFVGSTDSYSQVARYCNAEGIDAIRARPTLLDDEYRPGSTAKYPLPQKSPMKSMPNPAKNRIM